ncbi:MAG: hypothetical protein GAK45_00428 [Pseudomonas citronellolis]|nr:MAG: hypothetical protein GAK45_00428 [Pseudomonas citronellolis]
MPSRCSALRFCLGFGLFALFTAKACAAAQAPSAEAALLDADRYLLLFSATGDDRFLDRLAPAGKRFTAALAERKDASALQSTWSSFQQSVDKTHADYTSHRIDLKTTQTQALQTADQLDTYLKAHPAADAGSLPDNLRNHALQIARLANLRLVDANHAPDEEAQVKASGEAIQKQIDALENSQPAVFADLDKRWRYLKAGQTSGKLLLYPFNAQIEAMLGKLQGQ